VLNLLSKSFVIRYSFIWFDALIFTVTCRGYPVIKNKLNRVSNCECTLQNDHTTSKQMSNPYQASLILASFLSLFWCPLLKKELL